MFKMAGELTFFADDLCESPFVPVPDVRVLDHGGPVDRQ